MTKSNDQSTTKQPAKAVLSLILGVLLFVIAAFFSFVMVVPAVLHVKCYAVASGSMEPTMPVGSLVLVRKTEPADLKTGDIIVFASPRGDGENVTHRVTVNDQEQKQLTTKGDANESQDIYPVAYDKVVGKVVLHVPKAGTAVMHMQSWYGKTVIIAVLVTGFVLIEIGLRARTPKEPEKEQEEKA